LISLIPYSVTFANILLIRATFVALKWGIEIHGKIPLSMGISWSCMQVEGKMKRQKDWNLQMGI